MVRRHKQRPGVNELLKSLAKLLIEPLLTYHKKKMFLGGAMCHFAYV